MSPTSQAGDQRLLMICVSLTEKVKLARTCKTNTFLGVQKKLGNKWKHILHNNSIKGFLLLTDPV